MQQSDYPKLRKLVFLGFEINSLAEHCAADAVDFNYVYSGIKQRDLLKKLKDNYPDLIDLSVFEEDTLEVEKIYNSLENIANVLGGQERRKVGIEKNGLNLLISFLLEIIKLKSSFYEKT